MSYATTCAGLSNLRAKIRGAFKTLRKAGYIARANFKCCQGCGNHAIGVEQNKKGIADDDIKCVFYHQQDHDAMREQGYVYCSWTGNGHEIARAFEHEGLVVEWDGTKGKRIKVRLREEA